MNGANLLKRFFFLQLNLLIMSHFCHHAGNGITVTATQCVLLPYFIYIYKLHFAVYDLMEVEHICSLIFLHC